MIEHPTLRSYEFRKEREQTWSELQALLDRIESDGVHSLAAPDLARLPILYRATLSSLSVARTISLDRNVLEYLESLSARAYFSVYGTSHHPRDAIARFFARDFPRAVRRARWPIALAALFMLLGIATGFAVTSENEERFYTFVSPDIAGDRGPSTSTEDLKAGLYEVRPVVDGLTAFATFLFSHNARIGILAFALGFAAGLPVFFLMFINGLTLGAFSALYHARGLALDWWGWVLPHGITELLAVILCGGAGLVLGRSLVFPGRHARLQNLALEGREAGLIALGAVVLFFAASIVEGIFRQLVTQLPARYALIGASTLFWIAYLSRQGRGEGA